MTAAIKAELRKLLTVRSTYVLLFFCLAITVFVAFYIQGYRAGAAANSPLLLSGATTTTVQAISLFISLAGLLLVTHEYRYNTIMYTLTATNRRWKVPAAKIIVITLFAIVVTVVCAALAPVLARFGLQLANMELVKQNFNMADLLLKAIFYGWGNAMFAVIIALLIRSQVGAIVTLLLFPGVGETLLALLLRENAKYLPFKALEQFLASGQGALQAGANALTTTQSGLLVLAYIAVSGTLAFVLFARRDAN